MADSTYDAARYKRSGRGKIFDSVIDVIGDTSYRGDCPSETAEMIGFFSWLRSHHPKLAAVAVHVRNEGQRSKRQAVSNSAM